MLNCCGIICEGLLLISLLRSRFLGCHATLPQRNFGGALRDIQKKRLRRRLFVDGLIDNDEKNNLF